jgi:hypothetical protein
LALGLAALRIRRVLLDLCRHYFGPHGVAANHESARIDGKMGEDGCLEACRVITSATFGLGSFQVRERGCPGRLLRPTSLWVSEFLFADVTVREEGASSRGGRGWFAVRRERLAEGRVIGGRRDIRAGLRLADRANLAVFCWTQECGWCPMLVQGSRTRSGSTRSTLIWEIRAEGYLRCCAPTGYSRSSITCSSAAMPVRVAAGAGLGLHPG